MSRGIHANNQVLAEFGDKIGDKRIPRTSARDSVVDGITWVILCLGLALIVLGIADAAGSTVLDRIKL